MTSCNRDTDFDVVIYHKNCLDGLASAWVYWYLTKGDKSVSYYWEEPSASKVPPGLYGKRILIVDVSYEDETLAQIAEDAECLLLIDHHVSNQRTQDKLTYTSFDMKHSACVGTWMYFFPDEKVPLFLKLIEANDLGHFDNKEAMAFVAYMNYIFPRIHHKHIDIFDKYIKNKKTYTAIQKGQVLANYIEQLIRRNARHEILSLDLGKGKKKLSVCIANVTTVPLKGRIATQILDEDDRCDISMAWAFQERRYSVVVRTKKEDIDVSEIAKQLSGGEKAGGHGKAAHFFYNGKDIYDLFEK